MLEGLRRSECRHSTGISPKSEVACSNTDMVAGVWSCSEGWEGLCPVEMASLAAVFPIAGLECDCSAYAVGLTWDGLPFALLWYRRSTYGELGIFSASLLQLRV